MRQCLIKVMVVFGQYFLQPLKMLPLGARDAHVCLVHLVIVLSSALFFLCLWGGVATGQCSWYCSSPNHLGGIADTVGPQLEDLQHCCQGECCLTIQLREVSEESVVHLFDFIRMVSSCGSYYINVTRLAKLSGVPWVCLQLQCTDSTSIQVCPFSRNFSTRLCTESLLTESSTTDSRWSKNAWCKVAVLQFTIHLMPEVTHDITVRQVVDCKVMTVKRFCSNLHLQIRVEPTGSPEGLWWDHDVIISFGLLFIILLFLSWLFFSLFMLPEVLFGDSAIFMSKTHTAQIFWGGCIWQCFEFSFPWIKLVWILRVFLWNRSTLETLWSDVCVK